VKAAFFAEPVSVARVAHRLHGILHIRSLLLDQNLQTAQKTTQFYSYIVGRRVTWRPKRSTDKVRDDEGYHSSPHQAGQSSDKAQPKPRWNNHKLYSKVGSTNDDEEKRLETISKAGFFAAHSYFMQKNPGPNQYRVKNLEFVGE
jgi:hypothetical protein